jgi:hypothetical protein
MANAFTNQVASFTIVILDSQTPPQPAKVDGIPVYASSDETILTVASVADGMSGTVTTVSVGTARFTVTADADLGAGVTTITGTSEDVVVTQNPDTLASSFTITLSPFANPGP